MGQAPLPRSEILQAFHRLLPVSESVSERDEGVQTQAIGVKPGSRRTDAASDDRV
jgi:hypothetical protein